MVLWWGGMALLYRVIMAIIIYLWGGCRVVKVVDRGDNILGDKLIIIMWVQIQRVDHRII
mgnify:CR=1 FL=1